MTIKKRIGKARARQEFSTLVEAVASGAGPVEITDYGKVAAVLLSEKEYQWLCACAKKTTQPKQDARGFIVFHGEVDLVELSKEIATDFEQSINKTASEL